MGEQVGQIKVSPTVDGEVRQPASGTAVGELASVTALPLPSSRCHFCTDSFVFDLTPSICAGGLVSLCNLCFQLVVRKSLFDSYTPTHPASQPAPFPPSPPLPRHFRSASSLSFAFVPLPQRETVSVNEQ